MFRQDSSTSEVFESSDYMSFDDSEPDKRLFSALDRLSSYLSYFGQLHFRLVYPETKEIVEWIQTSNPATSPTIEGFIPIRVTDSEFKGLGRNEAINSDVSDIDASPQDGSILFPLGAKSLDQGGFKGPHGKVYQYVELSIASESTGKTIFRHLTNSNT